VSSRFRLTVLLCASEYKDCNVEATPAERNGLIQLCHAVTLANHICMLRGPLGQGETTDSTEERFSQGTDT
ncbi:hypothetical protein KUCAC02_020043, partial [Chaenocephalus aceratus]